MAASSSPSRKKLSTADVGDHLSSQESFRFALHVATLAVLIVAFVTMVSQIGKVQDSVTDAAQPVAEVMVMEEPVAEVEETNYFEEAVTGEEVLGIETNEYDEFYTEESYFEEAGDETLYAEEEYFGTGEEMLETEIDYDESTYFGE